MAGTLSLMLMATAAGAATRYPDVRDMSGMDAGGARVLRQTIEINAPAKAVWAAFTDAPTVLRWSATMAVIDLRQGGSMEESYQARAKPGDPENIRHEIIAYVPDRVLVFRNTNAPSGLPERESYKRIVSILSVQDIEGGRSRLELAQTGYAAGPQFDALYRFFSEGNADLMEQLKSELESPTGKLHAAVR